ncbi:MAG: UDP-3-O-(3-hydroxymyristoyl)glucosamine N-acyltransferase [Sulfurimonadaceae bacterium]
MIELRDLMKEIGVDLDGQSIDISALNTLSDASSNELSFLQNKSYVAQLKETKAGAVLVTADMAENVPSSTIAVVVDEPYLALAKASRLFAPALIDLASPDAIIGEGTQIAEGANLAKGAVIGKNCTIMPGVYIGRGAVIGDNTIIHANVSVYHDCEVGSNCIIHASSVIGSDGFGFATTKLGTHVKIYQNGNVVIKDDVEIGSCTTVDRAAFGSTLIKEGVRIDNLVQIGHNCVIGEYSVLVSQSGVAGSTELGRNVVLGGQAAAAGHLKIAPFTTFAARAGITNDVKESHKVYGGFPLMEQRTWLKLQVKLARLLKS